MSEDSAPSRFTYITHWPQGTPKDGAAVLEFWRRENAIDDEAQAQQRLREVVLHAVSDTGDIAGVCTAIPITLPQLGQPMYYYRCFIGRNWRSSRLALHLLDRTFEVLDGYARSNAFPCIGMLLELENQRFEKKWRMAVWPWNDFIYIGKSGRGLGLRVRYFRGARLK